ncbi:MAG: hypothetical protein WBK55_01385 [Alphaproteobacteria bacterium]
MNTLHFHVFGIIFLYCMILAWLSVPFVTTDKTLLRKQVMFIENLEEQIVADAEIPAVP